MEVFKNLSPPYNFELLRPSGMVEKIVPTFKGQNILIQFDENNESGNYQIWKGDELLTAYAVNHNPIESILIYYSNKELESIFDSGQIINDDQDVLIEIERKRFGKELWPYILGVVFLLLLSEMIVAYTGSRKNGLQIQDEAVSF